MIETKLFLAHIHTSLFQGVKIPHQTSYPVIRKEGETYYLAVFVYFHTKDEVEANMVSRPTLWALFDIDTGDMVKKFETKDRDFSDASYEDKYDIHIDGEHDVSLHYYEKAFTFLDIVRTSIIEKGRFRNKPYKTYLNMILQNVPKEYQRFYTDLSMPIEDKELTLDDLPWNPKYRITQIPEDILQKAISIMKRGLIKEVTINQEKKTVQISYFFTCINADFEKKIPRIDDSRFISRTLSDPIKTCDNNSCGQIRCITNLAGYLKYVFDNDLYEELLAERDLYRQQHGNQDEPFLFSVTPEDADVFCKMPPYVYDIAQELVERRLIAVDPYPPFVYDFNRLGFCGKQSGESSSGLNYGSFCSGHVDINRILKYSEDIAINNSHGIRTTFNFSLKAIPCANCSAAICPFRVAAYAYYLKYSGRWNEFEAAKETASQSSNVYYGKQPTYVFPEWAVNGIKENVLTASQETIDLALKLLDSGEAAMSSVPFTSKDGNGREKTYYRLLLARAIDDDAKTLSDAVSDKYSDELRWFGMTCAGWAEAEPIPGRRLIQVIGGIDYLRRTGVDVNQLLEYRKTYLSELKQKSKDISGLSRLYSFIKSKNASSLSAIMQGGTKEEVDAVLSSIAKTLSQTGKIQEPKYLRISCEGLMQCLTMKASIPEYGNKEIYPTYDKIHPNVLHVIDGLHNYLKKNGAYQNDMKDNYQYEANNLINVLGSFEQNTYIIILSDSKADTDDFLSLDKRFSFTFGQNIVTFHNKSTGELYDEYVNGLSEDVKAKIADEGSMRTKFAEFIAFNERFLPFNNTSLSHYLSEYSNVEGEPVFPPDIYDKRKTRDALSELVGMSAVKKQVEDFESYITYQKKAKAAGINIERGNMHMQFLGNPGTGKTTVARIIAKMLYEIGILNEDKLVEVERKDLVAIYVGQTAVKTYEKIKEALGGVLFIDEAYSLYQGDGDSYGKEAIATLIKAMEDHKSDFIVIFAGYSKELSEFLKANSGIESRIGYTFQFEDFNANELLEIFTRNMTKQQFKLDNGVSEQILDICDHYRRRKNFGNGRFVKKIEQETIINHAKNYNIDGWKVDVITVDDVPDVRDMAAKGSRSEENSLSLDELVGMQNIKDQIVKFKKKIKFEQNAKAAGAKLKRGNSHMLFLGNSGTGKTTIARIISKELYEAGVIMEDKLIEVERKDLVGQYVGQTAPKTSDVIDRAIGGVLFIDEAYSLTQSASQNDYGHEAIATIIKAMEDKKDDLVVIFAGYEKEMQTFLESNSGIASRIGYTFTFEDFTAEELTDIFKLKLKQNGLSCTDAAAEAAKNVMQYFVSVPNFGNGRFAERVVNMSIELHAERMSDTDEIRDDFLVIGKEDVPTVKYLLDHMPDGKKMINPEKIKDIQMERTAVHELGHALLQKLLDPDNSIERITISAEGSGALGYVRHNIDSVGTPTKSELENRICVSMAGIAAEEVFFDEHGNGGTSDLENATTIAKNMVMRFGMSKSGFAYTDELSDSAKEEINEILKTQFDRAKETVQSHKEALTKAKTFLLEKRTISDEEFSSFIS